MDIGKSLNPAIDVGQIEGGFIQVRGTVPHYPLFTHTSFVNFLFGSVVYSSDFVCTLYRFRVKTVNVKTNDITTGNKTLGPISLVICAIGILLARDSMLRALCYRKSVCPSVCPSHGWISRKRLKLGSCNFHHTCSSPIPLVFAGKVSSRNSDGIPRAGASNNGGLRPAGNNLFS